MARCPCHAHSHRLGFHADYPCQLNVRRTRPPEDRRPVGATSTSSPLSRAEGRNKAWPERSGFGSMSEASTRMLEILELVESWAGGPERALEWYRTEPIPAFGGRTAEALVLSRDAEAVIDYLKH